MANVSYALVYPNLVVENVLNVVGASGLPQPYNVVTSIASYFLLAPTSPTWVPIPSNLAVAPGWYLTPTGYFVGPSAIVLHATPVAGPNGAVLFNDAGAIGGTLQLTADETGNIYAAGFNATEQVVTLSGAATINYAAGRDVSATIIGNVTSLTITNWPPAGIAASLVLNITNSGAYTVSGWPGIRYSQNGTAPVIPSSGQACLILRSRDGGVTFYYDPVSTNYQTF
jgi:hypothetical protein